MNDSQELQEAVKRLRHNPDYGVVVSAINAYGVYVINHLVFNNDEELDVLRGEARAVAKILHRIGASSSPTDFIKDMNHVKRTSRS